MSNRIQNPILPGFHPDPSVCRVGDDYYIAVSTFEWYPGILIYHSKDFVNFEIVSRPLVSTKTVNLYGDPASCGLWAPHLSYADHKFWLVITDVKNNIFFKDTLNYIMTCDTVDGEWSEPEFVNASGFDPALFHDDDGRTYFMNMLWDYRIEYPNFHGIVIQEYDKKSHKLIGARKKLYDGTPGNVTEGPQIFKKDGYYYLVCAEGGTGYKHSTTVLRSKKIYGPYEKSPFWPVITSVHNSELELQKAGHASFVKVGEEWYITHLCARPLTKRGNCPLGRETAVQKIEWVDGWPRLYSGENEPELMVEAPAISADVKQNTNHSTMTDFEEDLLPVYFQSLRGNIPEEKCTLKARKGYLRLYGQQSLRSLFRQSLLARRAQSFHYRAETKLEFQPENFQQMAGLVCYYMMENWMYLYVSYHEERGNRVLGMLMADQGTFSSPIGDHYIDIPEETKDIYLAVMVEREKMQFSYSFDGIRYQEIGPVLPADHLSDDYIEKKTMVFTGSMVGICVQDMDQQKVFADFDYFKYEEM